MAITAEQVKKWIGENTAEVVNDIQCLLEAVCCGDCRACDYSKLCIREWDEVIK